MFPLPVSPDFIFTLNGKTPIGNYSELRQKIDKASGNKSWVSHDLRLVARSLMSRAGVNADVAERCAGHLISGVRGLYDHYEYYRET